MVTLATPSFLRKPCSEGRLKNGCEGTQDGGKINVTCKIYSLLCYYVEGSPLTHWLIYYKIIFPFLQSKKAPNLCCQGLSPFTLKLLKMGAFRTCPTSHSRPNGDAGQAGGKAPCILGVIPPLWYHHGDKVS